MLKYKLDCLVENKVAEKADKTYTAYILLYDDAVPAVVLAKFCLNYTTQANFETSLRAEMQKYKALNLNIDVIKTKVEASLRKIEKEVIL